VSCARGGTVFEITPEQWKGLTSAIGDEGNLSIDASDAMILVEQVAGKPGRQRLQLDAATRRAVELHAIKQAQSHYTRLGWTCSDVSARSPYDLHLIRFETGEELRVEVKGTVTEGGAVLLTRGEVRHARASHRMALFVVAGIQVQRSPGRGPVASDSTNRGNSMIRVSNPSVTSTPSPATASQLTSPM
jgi:Protein NO VEIN, C-terminal